MKILLNMATLKKGGGQNVGINYLRSLHEEGFNLDKFHFVVARDSSLEKYLISKNNRSYTPMPRNPMLRIIRERLIGAHILKKYKIDVIYTLFGIGAYPRRYPQFSGSADSNLFYPEIDFWKDYKGLARLKRSIVDYYRKKALRKAFAVIFENESMLIRSKNLFNLQRVLYSRPSVSFEFEEKKISIPKKKKNQITGLFLCGWHKNKNYQIIPELLCEFKKRGINFHIILTASKTEKQFYNSFIESIEENKVVDKVSVIGPVDKSELKSLYESIDFVFLLSKLESFSNTIIEAWFMKKPLVISDEDWSRTICKDAAVYVKRESVIDIVDTINKLIIDDSETKKVLKEADKALKTYPTIKEKITFELDYIKSFFNND